VGMTKDLGQRIIRHKDSRANQFAAKYDVRKLVYYEKYKNLEEAIRREKQLKKWNRRWKIRIIEQLNPRWEDLFGEVIKTKILDPRQKTKEVNPGDRRENSDVKTCK